MRRSLSTAPLWMRWAISLALAGSLLAALTIALVRDPYPDTPTASARVTLSVNRLGAVVVREDQAPPSASLPAAADATTALERSIAADSRRRIAVRNMTGPLDSVRCRVLRRGGGGRLRYACTVVAGALSYPFRAVLDLARHTLVWCKLDAVSGPGLSVPLAPRCVS